MPRNGIAPRGVQDIPPRVLYGTYSVSTDGYEAYVYAWLYVVTREDKEWMCIEGLRVLARLLHVPCVVYTECREFLNIKWVWR